MAILAFLVTVVYIPGFLGISIQPGWALMSSTLPLATCKGTTASLPIPLQLLGIGFIAYALLSLYWSPNVYYGINALWQQGCLAFAFIAGARLANTDKVVKALAVGLSISSLLTILQALGYHPVMEDIPGRHPGLLYSVVILSQATAFTIIWLVSKKLWWWIPTLLPGLYFAHSRSGPVILIVVGCVWLLRHTWLASLVLLAALGYTIRTILFSGTEDAYRIALWIQTVFHLTPRGSGAGAMDSIYLSTPIGLVAPEYAHNEFLDLAYQYGIAAAIPIGICLWALRKDNAQEWYVLLAVVFAACFSYPLHAPVTAFISALCMGHLYRYRTLAWSDIYNRRYGFLRGVGQRRSLTNSTRGAPLPLQPNLNHAQ